MRYVSEPRKPLRRILGPDIKKTPPRDGCPEPLRRGVGLRPVLPNQVVRPAGLGTVRTTVVRHVHHVGEHLGGDCDQKVVSAEDRDRELRRFFPTVGAESSEAPSQQCPSRGVVRPKGKRPSCRHDPIPEAIEFEEEGRVEPPSETIVRMALAVIPRHDVGVK